jgi:hypothetical protein
MKAYSVDLGMQAIPVSLLPASTAFDALAPLGVDEEGLSKAGNYALVFGLGGAAGAAATWILNYYEIENSQSAGWPSTTASRTRPSSGATS